MTDRLPIPTLPELPILPDCDAAPAEVTPIAIPAEIILPPLPGEAAADAAIIPAEAVPAEIILPEAPESAIIPAEAAAPAESGGLVPLTDLPLTQSNSEFRIPHSPTAPAAWSWPTPWPTPGTRPGKR